VYIHEAITKAQEENLCIKRECWDSARIEFEGYYHFSDCELYVNRERWLPTTFELAANDWMVCAYPEWTETLHTPSKKKPEVSRLIAIIASCVSLLVSLAALLLP